MSNKFSYAPGTTYEFKYEVETKTQMLGGSEDHSTIGISATANIEIHSKCELILQVSRHSFMLHYNEKRDKKRQTPSKQTFSDRYRSTKVVCSCMLIALDTVYNMIAQK